VASADGDLGNSVIETVRGEGYRMSAVRKPMGRVGMLPASAAFAGA